MAPAAEIELLRIVLWAQGAILLILLVALVVRIAVLDRRRAHRKSALSSVHASISRDLARARPSQETEAGVRRLDPMARAELFESLGRNFSGDSGAIVRDLAGRLGVVEQAVRMTRSRRWWTRLRGLRFLSAISVSADEDFRRLRRDRRPAVRAEAIEASANLPSPPVGDIVAGLSDPAPICRFAAEQVLHRLGGTAAPEVARALRAPVSEATRPLLRVAASRPDPDYLPPAAALARHPDAAIRAGALRLLGSLGGDDAVAALEAGLDDRAEAVRAAAAAGLGTLNQWQAAPRTARLLRDPAWDVRRAAGHALRRFGAPGHLVLRRALSDPDRFAADMARQVLDHPDHAYQVRRR